MRVRFRDFRCFHLPASVELRRINLLVGENSAGKTSFMAGTRFLFELFRRGFQPSFNKDPFYLGSFDQIAHFRGGRFGRAKSFFLEMEGRIPRLNGRESQRDLFLSENNVGDLGGYSLSVGFCDYKGQPAIERVDFSGGPYRFSAEFKESMLLTISTPATPEVVLKLSIDDSLEPSHLALSYVEYVLQDLKFMQRREKVSGKSELELLTPNLQLNDRFFEESRFLSTLFRAVMRSLPEEIYASAPVRSKPERTYNLADYGHSADGGHIPFVLAQLKYFDSKKSEDIEKELSSFGKASGLFDRVQIKPIGRGPSSPFQIIVSLPNRKSNIIDVGYGVSQALPIAAELLRMRSATYLFQQPEVHLHPRAQAELGSFFARVAKQRNHTLLIETHSDYLIDRIRMEVRKGQLIKPHDVSLLYFARKAHDVEIHQIEFDTVGNVVGAPEGYRDFFLEEEMRSLGINLE